LLQEAFRHCKIRAGGATASQSYKRQGDEAVVVAGEHRLVLAGQHIKRQTANAGNAAVSLSTSAQGGNAGLALTSQRTSLRPDRLATHAHRATVLSCAATIKVEGSAHRRRGDTTVGSDPWD
jgi:hypothetical protein